MRHNRLAQNSGYGISVIKISVLENHIPPLKAAPAKNHEFRNVKAPAIQLDENSINERLNLKFE